MTTGDYLSNILFGILLGYRVPNLSKSFRMIALKILRISTKTDRDEEPDPEPKIDKVIQTLEGT